MFDDNCRGEVRVTYFALCVRIGNVCSEELELEANEYDEKGMVDAIFI